MLEAKCSPYHGNVALWPVGRMLEQLLGFYPDQTPEERLTNWRPNWRVPGWERDVVPLLAPLVGLETGDRYARPEVDAPALRQQTLQALVTWLADTAASTPTLVWADDLHWADPTTVDLLGLLATQCVPGTMILITSRFALEAPWAPGLVDIELEPLKEKEATGLVAVLTDGELDRRQCRQIVERGAGIPLFLQELTRSAVTTSPGEVLPPRIHEILTARLALPASTCMSRTGSHAGGRVRCGATAAAGGAVGRRGAGRPGGRRNH